MILAHTHLETVKKKFDVLERGVLAQDEDSNIFAVESFKEAVKEISP